MITPLQSAQLCADIYDQDATKWDHYWDRDHVTVGHRIIGGEDTLTFMGSKQVIDFLRDAEGWPSWDDELGFCHAGFLAGMDDVLEEIAPVITLPLTIQGHSLGGARARIAAAKLIIRKKAPARLHVFGSPKPFFANVARVIQKGMAMGTHLSFRNRNDPVPLVPMILPWWSHTEEWAALDVHADDDELEPTRDHAMALYIKGLS